MDPTLDQQPADAAPFVDPRMQPGQQRVPGYRGSYTDAAQPGLTFVDPGAVTNASGDPYSAAEPPPPPTPSPAEMKQAMAGVQQAMRWQGQRGFEEALKRGVPPEQAILDWGSKMFFNDPHNYVNAMKSYRKAPEFTAEIRDVDGVKLLHKSPNTWQALDKGNKDEAAKLDQTIAMAKWHAAMTAKAKLPPGMDTEASAADKEINRLEGQLRRTVKTRPPQSAGVRVRDKKTGKYYRWMGNPDDLKNQTEVDVLNNPQ
jgi:hypothetical protein